MQLVNGRNETLIVAFGENPDLMYKGHVFEFSTSVGSPRKIMKNIKDKKYLL